MSAPGAFASHKANVRDAIRKTKSEDLMGSAPVAAPSGTVETVTGGGGIVIRLSVDDALTYVINGLLCHNAKSLNDGTLRPFAPAAFRAPGAAFRPKAHTSSTL